MDDLLICMLKVIDLVYFSNNDCSSPEEVLLQHSPAIGFVDHIKDKVDISLVKHCNYEGVVTIKNVVYAFFKRKNSFLQIPFKTHRYIKAQKPDVVIVNGLIFPFQVIALKLILGKCTKLILQHHGEMPYNGFRGMLQKLADRFIDGYLFTSNGNATSWINKGIIASIDKCYEVLEASTYIRKKNKDVCKAELHFTGSPNFLCVGRLNHNKDPLFLLSVFLKYSEVNSQARLYIVYQEEELLAEVSSFIQLNRMSSSVFLVGRILHAQLSTWYSAADFFLSSSKREGSGYALLEAMACGCIPIVTDIPAFNKITAKGNIGFLYPPGDKDSLYRLLVNTGSLDAFTASIEVQQYFIRELSFEKIANDLYKIMQLTQV